MNTGNNPQAIDRAAALIVAAIARRMSGMSSTPTSATAGSTAAAASGGSVGGAVSAITSFATKLLAILAPISVTAAVIGAATSGMSVFLGSLKLLGALAGTVIAPVFLVLAAVALSLSDVIQSQLLPNLAQLQAQILAFGTNAVAALEGKFYELAVKVLTAAIQLDRLTETAGGLMGVFDKIMSWNPATALQWRGAKWLAGGGDGPAAKEQAQQELKELVAQLRGGAGAAGGGAAVGAGRKPLPDFMGLFQGNLQTALDQMRHESGPKAQQSGLIQASMNAQMAAFMSPFEQKQLDLQQKNLEALQEAVEAVKRLQPPVGK